jgi:hypothetical protein
MYRLSETAREQGWTRPGQGQRCIAVIGEHSPSDEFMAYSIQQISEELFKLYMEQKT